MGTQRQKTTDGVTLPWRWLAQVPDHTGSTDDGPVAMSGWLGPRQDVTRGHVARFSAYRFSNGLESAALCVVALLLAGCSKLPELPDLSGTHIPGVYRIDIQQGNVLKRESLAQIEPGMSKRKIRFLLGTPAVTDLFHADRWDYIYTHSREGDESGRRHVSLYFEDDTLVRTDGLDELLAAANTETEPAPVLVDVPKGRSDGSIFGRFTRRQSSISDEDSAPIGLTPDDPRVDPNLDGR